MVIDPIRGLSEGATFMAAGLEYARKHDKRTEVDELRMEVRAAGHEMRAIGQRIYSALAGGHTAVAMHEAGRLVSLGERYAQT